MKSGEIKFMSDFILSAFADEAAEDLQGQIDALKRNNIKHIEIRNIDGKCIIDYSEDELKSIKKQLDENDIKVSAIGSPIGKCSITDDFGPHIETFKKTIKSAQILDTKRIRMFSFLIPKDENADDYKDEVIKRLKTLIDLSVKEDVYCYHENEKEVFGDTKERVLYLFNTLGENFKGIFDPANYIQCNEAPIEIFDEVSPYVDYMHIKDALFEDGSVVPASYGDANIKELIMKFNKPNTSQILTVEPHLTVFKGLENLQDEGVKHKFKFESQGEAFDVGVKALKKILNNGGYSYE